MEPLSAFERLCAACRDGKILALQVARDLLEEIQDPERRLLSAAVSEGIQKLEKLPSVCKFCNIPDDGKTPHESYCPAIWGSKKSDWVKLTP